MKHSPIFLSHLPKEQKEFINLLDATAKVHGETLCQTSKSTAALWDADFYQLNESDLWKSLSPKIQNEILISLGQKILQEAYFIECAGMSYAAKMNLVARTKEERAFFCFVAEEEARHLRLIESLADFSTSLDTIPSFALLIGEIIEEADRPSHLLLIQILLEGWGLHYYKSLAQSAQDPSIANVFKTILKDEIRHHSAGVILFKSSELEEKDIVQFLNYLQRIAFMVKVGPWAVCQEIMKHVPNATPEILQKFLKQIKAQSVTYDKMTILSGLLVKSLPERVWETLQEKKLLSLLTEAEMTQFLAESIL